MAYTDAHLRIASMDGCPVIVQSKPYYRGYLLGRAKLFRWGHPANYEKSWEADRLMWVSLLNPRDPGLTVWALDRFCRKEPFLPQQSVKLSDLRQCRAEELVGAFDEIGAVQDEGWARVALLKHQGNDRPPFAVESIPDRLRDTGYLDAIMYGDPSGERPAYEEALGEGLGYCLNTWSGPYWLDMDFAEDRSARKAASVALGTFAFSAHLRDYCRDNDGNVLCIPVADCLEALVRLRRFAVRTAVRSGSVKRDEIYRTFNSPMREGHLRPLDSSFAAYMEKRPGVAQDSLWAQYSDEAFLAPEAVGAILGKRRSSKEEYVTYGIDRMFRLIYEESRRGHIRVCDWCLDLFVSTRNNDKWCMPNGACKSSWERSGKADSPLKRSASVSRAKSKYERPEHN